MSRRSNKKIFNYIGWILLYLYILLLSYFLFISDRYGKDPVSGQYNLHLFKEIMRFIVYRERIGVKSFAVNIFGNIAAFMPYGFLLPLLNRVYRKFYIILILSVLFSLAVETAQFLLKVGVFDVDDIILNSLGGILGYLVFRACFSIYERMKKRRK